MPDKKDRKSKGLGRRDAELWQAMTSDVKPLPGKKYAQARSEPEEPAPRIVERVSMAPPKKPRPVLKDSAGLDRRTAQKLARGQMKIEARLDLHGMNQRAAEDALTAFINRCHKAGKRCVLVITGKGMRGNDRLALAPGVLKQRVPQWLAEPDLKPLILKTAPAKPKDGGTGALYVLLRRIR
jgi:DNA-nicking Smr family endonuclease